MRAVCRVAAPGFRHSASKTRVNALMASSGLRGPPSSRCQTAQSSSVLGALLRPGFASLFSIRPPNEGTGSARGAHFK
jgi:hypothetical protein